MATITVTTFWNMDSRKWTSDLLGTTEQDPLAGLVQGDIVKFAVRFVQGGAAVVLTAPVFTASGIKAQNDFTGGYLIQLSAPVVSDTTLYTFTVSPLNSAQLNTFLQTYRNTWCALELYDSANGILTTPLELQITPGYSLSGTPTDNAPGTLNVAAGKTVTFPLSLTFPSAAGTNGYKLTTDGATTLSWTADNAGTGDVVGPASATDNAIVRFDGTTGKLVQNSAATIADTSGDITAGKYNGNTVTTGTGTLTLGNGSITISGNSPINTGGGTGYINTVGGSGYINTSSELGFNGGHINTQGGTSEVGGYIRTHAGVLGTGIGAAGGYINTSNGGGNIDTTAGGSITTGAGALTGPAGGGTIATNETISGGTLAGSFATLAGTSSATLGTNGGTGGSVVLRGSTSGSATINVSATGGLQLGTPTTLVLTSATGLPVSTGISGLGTGVATALALATNAVGGIATKKRTFITASDILRYNTGGFCDFQAQGTTFQAASMPDAADTQFQILLDPAEWAGRAAKVTVVFVGNVSSTANVNFDVGLDWKTTAIDGATNSMAGPGWGTGGGSPVQNLNQAGPATQPYPQKFTSQQWNITAGATFLSLWLKRNGTTDAYAGNISVLWISIDEQ
jgi:hypothetical protein